MYKTKGSEIRNIKFNTTLGLKYADQAIYKNPHVLKIYKGEVIKYLTGPVAVAFVVINVMIDNSVIPVERKGPVKKRSKEFQADYEIMKKHIDVSKDIPDKTIRVPNIADNHIAIDLLIGVNFLGLQYTFGSLHDLEEALIKYGVSYIKGYAYREEPHIRYDSQVLKVLHNYTTYPDKHLGIRVWKTPEDFKAFLKSHIAIPHSTIIVYSDLQVLPGTGTFHIPKYVNVGAYHEEENLILLMDTNFKFSSYWLDVDDVFTGMNTLDTITEFPRGAIFLYNDHIKQIVVDGELLTIYT